MKAIVGACRAGDIPGDVVLVISNRPDAPGIEWAREQGIPTRVLSHRDYDDRRAHDEAVVTELRAARVEWVCLAGYMRLLSAFFVQSFPERILNIHPSLLPAFPGLDAQKQAWDYGVRWTGCTVHLVDVELDHGPIVAQEVVSVADCRSAEDLADAILQREHGLYPKALGRLLSEEWVVRDRRLVFVGALTENS